MDKLGLDFRDINWNDPSSIFKAIGAGKQGGLPMPEFVSAEDVRQERRQRVSNIYADFERLQAIVMRHELTIQRRWMKRNREQRRKILLTTWPNMPSTHRPDYEAFTRESEQQRATATKFPDAYRYPHINQEDLLKPKAMLLFLKSRGRTSPDAFAMYDFNALRLGLTTKAITPPFLDQHTMMFNGRNNRDTYGELQAWEDHDDAFNAMMTGRGMHPGHGLEILRSQERLLSFLVAFCEMILQDMSPESLTDDQFSIVAEPPLAYERDAGFENLATMAAEAPYRKPASLDMSRVSSLISARVSAAKDHIWALREDPGHFVECVRELKEHSQEFVKDAHGNIHPLCKLTREDPLWTEAIGNLISEAYVHYEIWIDLFTQSLSIRSLLQKHEPNISVDKALPSDLLDAFLKFQLSLDQVASGLLLGQLKCYLAGSTHMRQYFVREPPYGSRDAGKIRIHMKPSIKLDKTKWRLFWLLRVFWENGERLHSIGLTTAVDELDRLLEAEPRAKELISPHYAGLISDLTIVSECTRQLDIYQPWAETFETALIDRKDDIARESARKYEMWKHFMNVFDGPEKAKLASIGNPSGQKFYYPVDKKRTSENTEAMIKAEQNLDAFWTLLDCNMRQAHNDLEGTAVRKLLAQPHKIERTAPWVESEQSKPKSVKEEFESVGPYTSNLHHDLEQRTEATLDPSTGITTHKTKVKTRGIPHATHIDEESATEVSQADATDSQPNFAVDKRALKAFMSLFYTPSRTATPGDLPWNDFLHAMVSTGFQAEKLYGSVWQFSPNNLDVERSIQFHEPHPSSKLPYKTARRFGRRLNRQYGWHIGMFKILNQPGK